MKNLSFILLIILFCLPLVGQAQKNYVVIKLKSTSLDSSSSVYISGNQSQLGSWSPNKVPLIKTGKFWEREFQFTQGEIIEFKFTLGNWNNEALDAEGNIPENHKCKILSDTTLTFEVYRWNSERSRPIVDKEITGEVRYHRNFTYKNILPRDIIVWLPPNYNEDLKRHYPVLYMQDGQNLFDPGNSFTGIDWGADETADSLIKNDIIEPMIIIGISNTTDRKEEYSPTKIGYTYMQFVVHRLKPFIDSLYRTLPERENTAVGGSSMGGLISFLLAWNYSDYFSKAACFSPAFMYEENDFTHIVHDYHGVKKDITFYIDNGGAGLEEILQPGVDKMSSELAKKGFIKNKDLFVVIDSAAEHNELAWSKRIHNPLKIFFPKKKYSIVNDKYNNVLDNRNRIQLTISSFLDRDDFKVLLPYILNFNYRNSHIDRDIEGKDFTLTISTEIGINLIADVFTVVPYIKVGPEIRIAKMMYLDLHGGLGGIIAPSIMEGLIAPFPFWGAETGYIIPVSENHSFEIECGFNTFTLPFLYYLAVSFSI